MYTNTLTNTSTVFLQQLFIGTELDVHQLQQVFRDRPSYTKYIEPNPDDNTDTLYQMLVLTEDLEISIRRYVIADTDGIYALDNIMSDVMELALLNSSPFEALVMLALASVDRLIRTYNVYALLPRLDEVRRRIDV